LQVENLTKHYPKVKAVDGISFSVHQGRCLGLLGPNGAGKSTTIEMLEGVLAPTSGQITYRGGRLDKRYRERVGIQFQSTALQDFLTVKENLRFFAQLYAKNRPIDELVRLCRLESFLDRDAKKLSGGQRQRLLLALALVNDPDVVFLDEPTTGLDPQARRNFWELVQGIKTEGKTLVLTTHYMEEAYQLCDDLLIIDQGKIIAEGQPQALLSQHFNDSVLELPLHEAKKTTLNYQIRGERAEISTHEVNQTLQTLLSAGVDLSQMNLRPRSLEDLFLALTGRDLRVGN
jgi:ABC-2 type transport system ATP-binding protein